MRIRHAFGALLFSLNVLALPSLASAVDWSACKKEMEKCKIDPKAKDKDEAIWACLEEQGETLSPGCEAVHVAYEKKHNKKVK